jgi:hypothetical protein
MTHDLSQVFSRLFSSCNNFADICMEIYVLDKEALGQLKKYSHR